MSMLTSQGNVFESTSLQPRRATVITSMRHSRDGLLRPRHYSSFPDTGCSLRSCTSRLPPDFIGGFVSNTAQTTGSFRAFTFLQPAAAHASIMAAARTPIASARPSAPPSCFAVVAVSANGPPIDAALAAGLPTGAPRGLYATASTACLPLKAGCAARLRLHESNADEGFEIHDTTTMQATLFAHIAG